MRRLAMLAELLQVSRSDLVAVLDGTETRNEIPAILSDAERRRRRKWWLGIARLTAGLGLVDAREAMATRGFRSERGNLVALWEDPRSRLEPSEAQLRALAEVYRLPLEELIDVWNNPPATDEEAMAARRGVRIEPVREDDPVELPGERRRTA